MLELFEKIGNWFCLGVILVVGLLYCVFALPPTAPREWVDEAVWEPVAASRAPPRTAAASTGEQAPETPARGPADDEIMRLLRDQNKQVAGQLKKYDVKVTRDTYDFIVPEASWMPELRLIHSQKLRGSRGETRLKLNRIAPNSLANKFGLKQGDVIELIDGQILDFNEQSTLHYRQMFKGALDRLANGESISLTITRNREPMHLQFSLR